MALRLLPEPADARPERLSLGDSQLGRTRRGWALFAEKQNCPTWARGKKQGASRRFEEEAEQLPFQLSPDLPRLVERGRGRETRLVHPGGYASRSVRRSIPEGSLAFSAGGISP